MLCYKSTARLSCRPCARGLLYCQTPACWYRQFCFKISATFKNGKLAPKFRPAVFHLPDVSTSNPVMAEKMLLGALQSVRVNNLLPHTHNLNQRLFFAAVLEFNRDSSVLVSSSPAAFTHVLVYFQSSALLHRYAGVEGKNGESVSAMRAEGFL